MAEGSLHLEGLRFVEGSAQRLVTGRWADIQDLRQYHWRRTLVSRSRTEVDGFVHETIPESWADPNRARRTRSRYAKTRAILAYRGPELTALVLTANNASSQREGKAKRLEERLKLHMPVDVPGVPSFTDSRYVNVREAVGTEDNVVLAGMTAHLLDRYYRDRQPVSYYAYHDEIAFQQELLQWGLQPDGEPEEVFPFGGVNEPILQTRFGAGHVRDVVRAIQTRPEARQVMTRIGEFTSIDAGSGIIPVIH